MLHGHIFSDELFELVVGHLLLAKGPCPHWSVFRRDFSNSSDYLIPDFHFGWYDLDAVMAVFLAVDYGADVLIQSDSSVASKLHAFMGNLIAAGEVIQMQRPAIIRCISFNWHTVPWMTSMNIKSHQRQYGEKNKILHKQSLWFNNQCFRVYQQYIVAQHLWNDCPNNRTHPDCLSI